VQSNRRTSQVAQLGSLSSRARHWHFPLGVHASGYPQQTPLAHFNGELQTEPLGKPQVFAPLLVSVQVAALQHSSVHEQAAPGAKHALSSQVPALQN